VAIESDEIHLMFFTQKSSKATDPSVCVLPLIYLYLTASLHYSYY